MSYRLPRSTPEAHGVPSSCIAAFLNELEKKKIELHSLMVLRDDAVIAEGWWAPYRSETPHLLYSLSKSFTSTAIGMAIEEGLFSLDDKVVSFFPDKVPPEVSDNLKSMTIRHLLTMSTGQSEANRPSLNREPEADWVADFLKEPVISLPGSKFDYSTPATFMCSAILRRVSGIDLLDYLMPRLFEPLGIERPTWQKSPDGISFGGSGLSLTTESIGKFGLLYLQRGAWNGKQLVPEQWIDLATSKQIDNDLGGEIDWSQGYGFQFWQCRHGAYRGDGAFGQYCVIVPDKKLVVAITSSVESMQAVLNDLWDTVLPALSDRPLVPADESLSQQLNSLRLPGPDGSAEPISGYSGSYASPSASWTVVHGPDEVELRFLKGELESICRAGFCDWISNPFGWAGLITDEIAAKAAWSSPTRLEVEVHEVTTPFKIYWDFEFEGSGVTVATRSHGRFGMAEEPEFIGIRESHLESTAQNSSTEG